MSCGPEYRGPQGIAGPHGLPLIPPSKSNIKPPYIPPPKPSVRTIPLHIADQAVAACEKEIAELKAEVERLRKAGDNLSRAIRENGCHDNGDFEDQQNAIKAWNAAKEGKPSV